MRVLVTGGAGFIGSHLVERLVADGHDVAVLDNFLTGRREHLAAVADRITLFEEDLRDFAAVCRAARGAELIFHQGALPSVPLSVERPHESLSINVMGTVHVLEAARREGVRRVVFASSSSVYGDAPELPKHEDLPLCPLSPYALAKRTGEELCRQWHDLFGLETAALRYFNVFGPRQDPNSPYAAVVPRFLERLRAGQPLTIYGDGSTTRDFTAVANVVEANLRAGVSAKVGAGEVINIACGTSTSLLELARALFDLVGREVPIAHEDFRPGDVRHSVAEVSRARALLDFTPRVTLAEGLKALVATG